MNTTEVARLAAAINLLRPDWPTPSLHTFIARELASRPYRDAAVALTYVAADPDSQTPRRVLEAGPWWKVGEASPADIGPRILVQGRCNKCRHMHAPDAPCIVTGRASAKAAEARALLQSARANLCPCGVKPIDCADHRPQPEETP